MLSLPLASATQLAAGLAHPGGIRASAWVRLRGAHPAGVPDVLTNPSLQGSVAPFLNNN